MYYNVANFYCEVTIENSNNFVLVIAINLKFCFNDLKKNFWLKTNF